MKPILITEAHPELKKQTESIAKRLREVENEFGHLKMDPFSTVYSCEFKTQLRKGMRLMHLPTKQEGVFVKEYTPTGRSLTYQIELDNGNIYFAPASEFRLMKSNFK